MLVTESPCAQKLTYNVKGMVKKIKLAVKVSSEVSVFEIE